MMDFERVKNIFYRDINNVVSDMMTPDDYCMASELLDMLKDIGQIEMFEDAKYSQEFGYPSEEGNSYGNNYNNMNGSSSQRSRYYNNSSYNNGEGYSGGSSSYRGQRGRSSYGYSRGDEKREMMDKMENYIHSLQNEQDKESVRRWLDQMKQQM